MTKGSLIAAAIGVGCLILWIVLLRLDEQNRENLAMDLLIAEAEAMGLPLRGSEVEPIPLSPESQAGWKRVESALVTLRGASRAARDQNAEAQTEAIRPAAEALRHIVLSAWDYRPDHAWGQTADPNFEDVALGMNGISGLLQIALADARAGKAPAALDSFDAATNLARTLGTRPTYVHALGKMGWQKRLHQAAKELMDIAPDSAMEVAAMAANLGEYDPGLHFRGEIYLGLSAARTMTEAELRKTVEAGEIDFSGGSAGEVRPLRDGWPETALGRQLFARLLSMWIRIYQASEPAAPFSDFAAAHQVMQAEITRASSGDEADRLAARSLRVFSVALPAFTRHQAELRLMEALHQGLVYRTANGRWPKTLAEAGVDDLQDPFSPPNPLRFAINGPEIRLWSVGENGQDDQGAADDLVLTWQVRS
jgi:hypothetical protein